MENIETKKTLIKIIISTTVLLFLNVFLVISNYKIEKYLKVYFLDIGQGDSIFIETPNKTQILIDAGPNNKVISELSKIIPFFDKTINVLIPTHSDLDHIAGFPEILRRFDIKQYFDSGFVDEDDLNNEIKILLQNEKGLEIKNIKAGDKIVFDQENNIFAEVLWPPLNYETKENNDRSIVLLLKYGQVSFLLTGDASIEIENKIIKNIKEEVSVLKAGHHGSKTSSSINFLKSISPKITIISAGKDNKFGHPDKEVLDNLNQVNTEIKNTADVGTILIKSDGENFWIKEKNNFEKLFN